MANLVRPTIRSYLNLPGTQPSNVKLILNSFTVKPFVNYFLQL